MTVTAEYFATSVEHVLAELERIDLLVRHQVWCARQRRKADDGFQGLYISEADVDDLLDRPIGTPDRAALDPSLQGELQAAIDRLRQENTRLSRESAAKGVTLRLVELARLFDLSTMDVDALLVCLAPELDLRYQRLYAYLQDDVTKTQPSVDLVLNVLCPSFAAKLVARSCCTARSPLLKNHLVRFFDGPAHSKPTFLGQYLKVDERVINYLLGSDEIDQHLLPYLQRTTPQARLDDLLLPDDLKARLEALAPTEELNSSGLLLYLQGPYGAGKRTTAEALCGQWGLALLVVNSGRLLQVSHDDFEGTIRLIVREALLQQAALYLDGFGDLLTDDKRTWRETLVQELAEHHCIAFLAGEAPWDLVSGARGPTFLRVEFPPTTPEQRVGLWQSALDGDAPLGKDIDFSALANTFRLSGGQILDAAVKARHLARWRDPEGSVNPADIFQACRLLSNQRLSALAQKIAAHYTWNDIVLPPDRLQQLREVCNYVTYRGVVYQQWGFANKQALGKGLNVLLAGPSGTGKTMAAAIMAGELGLDLYKIDLSMVVSKFIGETEKNLSRVFSEAETSNAILFFDEADALFGKRTEVRDAHDRYANIEVSYLLQRMEEYDGVVMLATNMRKNMDDAFVRRMHFMLEFPMPGEAERRRIWQQVWPDDAPRSPDLDLDIVARRFELSGGNIRNAALAAAFLAADDGGPIAMTHLLRAIRREYQKMGKVVAENDFGDYDEAPIR